MMPVYVTVDMEQDCPPYWSTWRGVEEGTPRLLEMLKTEGVPATWFTTGDLARRFPATVQCLVDDGHELGCHGDTHRSFATMTRQEAEAEIAASSAVLRTFADVVSFRAPYLQFPADYVGVLRDHGYRLDSSEGRHKHFGARVQTQADVLRVPASVTSSTLRWVAPLRNALFRTLNDPVVLFVHPWEFVDLRKSDLRLDCRFKTGEVALDCLRDCIRFFRGRGATFAPMRSCLETQ